MEDFEFINFDSNYIDDRIKNSTLDYLKWSQSLDNDTKKKLVLTILIANMSFIHEYPERYYKLKELYYLEIQRIFEINLENVNFEILNNLSCQISSKFINNRYKNKDILIDDFIHLTLFVNSFDSLNLEIRPVLRAFLLNFAIFCGSRVNFNVLLVPKRVNLIVFSPLLLNAYKMNGNLNVLLEKNSIKFDEINRLLGIGLDAKIKLNFNEYMKDPIFKDESLFNPLNIVKFIWRGEKNTIHIKKAEIDPLYSKTYMKSHKKYEYPFFDSVNINSVDSFDHYATTRVTHSVILISGFTSEGIDQAEWWSKFVKTSDYTNFYFYNWESKTPWSLVTNIIGGIPKIINPFTFGAFKTQENLFSKTKFASKKFGQFLAYIIASNTIFRDQTISLVGFSLGSNVIKHCLKKLFEISEYYPSIKNIISNVVFVAGATYFKNTLKWTQIFKSIVNGRCINCFSKNDKILSVLFKFTTNSDATGLIPNNKLKMEFFEFKHGHTNYKTEIADVRQKINIEFI